ncbi:vinorine synthase-like [Sesamum indicum]|uniref:Vinorine synthase-like n=1 Tax=Sesamum indicum TaxID=4182 RepID=A0A6I9UI53_SESIN|nr:vinorine synthase-like [Sesamum indicum]
MASWEIAKEMIKPSSSPVPPHLRKLELSFLDQLAPPTYIHIILYYQAFHHHHDSGETSRKLKRSLSNALAIYYPLAGRIREDSWVDCNDAGAEYVEAWFNNVQLSDVVEKSGTEELKQYVPVEPSGGPDIPLAVQVSFFGCGGTAIGVCLSHRVADAMSLVTFINAWAAACRGDTETIAVTEPTFGLASRFPPADFSKYFPSRAPQPPPPPPPRPEKIVTKRFVFNEQKLAALRNAASGPIMEKPTRVEAVSAFIWRHFIKAERSKDKINGKESVFTATHAVDIRPRASPPLPRQFFGNACARAMAMTTTAETEPDYYRLTTKLRDGIRKANADYVTRLENGDSFLKYYADNEENDPAFKHGRKILEMCGFTSWYRLPAYEVNYGWGKPVWVSIIGVQHKNLIFFLGTKSGDGIEAWVNMLEEDMAIIEDSYHLLNKLDNNVKSRNG